MMMTTAVRRRTPIRRQAITEPICPVRVIVFTALTTHHHGRCIQEDGRSSPPFRTYVSTVAMGARWVAWLESPSYGQAWASGPPGQPMGKPWPLRKVTCCTAWRATTYPDVRPSYPGWKNSCSAIWWTAASSERPTMAPGIFSVA